MCKKHKDRETKFYVNTDPMYGSETCTPICRDCARKIALRVDKQGHEHEPTKESVILALKYLQKPFLDTVWNSSIAESENTVTGKQKFNVWTSYIKNIQMTNYIGLTFFDSDIFKQHADPDPIKENKSEKDVIDEHVGLDTYDSF